MADDARQERDAKTKEEFLAENPAAGGDKLPGEGNFPSEQDPTDPGNTHGDTPDEAVGAGPSGGAPTKGDPVEGGGDAVGDGPSGGAPADNS